MSKNPSSQKSAKSPFPVVSLEKLTPRMVLVAYVGLADNYRPMDQMTSQWLKHNFQGVHCTIVRNQKKQKCLIDHIETGDHLLNLYNFPPSKKKLTRVTPGFLKELKRHGFLRFQVKLLKKAVSAKQRKHQKDVFESVKFLEKARKGAVMREKATEAVKEMMDDVRKGKPSANAVKEYVNQIVESSSADAIKAVASLKQSDQTYAHCVDAAAIFQSVYFEIQRRRGNPSIFEQDSHALLGGFMHDVGKAKVPKDVLESTVRFERESKEMKLLQSHPVFGAEILEEMGMPHYLVNMAHYHHVKMDTNMNSSYPAHVSYDEVIMETRLVSIVDVYQALIGKRSYKKSWAPAAATRYIDALAGVEFDPAVWEDFLKVNGLYPVGSLVELSDGSMAFVMSVPLVDLNRPQVVVIRNANQQDVQNHTLIDLAEEKDLSIVKDLDHHEILGDDALDLFLSIRPK